MAEKFTKSIPRLPFEFYVHIHANKVVDTNIQFWKLNNCLTKVKWGCYDTDIRAAFQHIVVLVKKIMTQLWQTASKMGFNPFCSEVCFQSISKPCWVWKWAPFKNEMKWIHAWVCKLVYKDWIVLLYRCKSLHAMMYWYLHFELCNSTEKASVWVSEILARYC